MNNSKGESDKQCEGNGQGEEEYLFEASILKNIKWEDEKSIFKNNLSPSSLPNNFTFRPLSTNDYWKGYLALLSQLTSVGNITEEMFLSIKRFESMKRSGDYFVMVVEDISKNIIVGSTTIAVEQKFIHETTTRGRLEDVVVHEDYRGQQIGKLLVQMAVLLSKHLGCYKTSLDCKESKIPFYELFEFKPDCACMTIRHHD